MSCLPPISTLFPYTTLFRSAAQLPPARDHIDERLAKVLVEHCVIDYAGFVAVFLPHRNLRDRKSTRLNSSHLVISYAVFCLKKKKKYDFMNMISLISKIAGL